MGHTLTEKIIARAAGLTTVLPGQIVTVKVDLAMAHDSSGPAPLATAIGGTRCRALGPGEGGDRLRPLCAGGRRAASAQILHGVRKFVADYGVKHFYDMKGICHVILPEHGHLLPGMLIAGGDSHSPMAGAFGCYMLGFGATDTTGIVVTGETWLDVPETIRVEWSGAFGQGVVAKDVMLFLCRELGMDNAGRVIEFGGPAVRAMSMEARMVLCNMTAEVGADTGLVEPDDKTIAHIVAHGGQVAPDALSWRSDADAVYLAVKSFDAAELSPQVAAPHSPANSAAIAEHRGVSGSTRPISAPASARSWTIWRWRRQS